MHADPSHVHDIEQADASPAHVDCVIIIAYLALEGSLALDVRKKILRYGVLMCFDLISFVHFNDGVILRRIDNIQVAR